MAEVLNSTILPGGYFAEIQSHVGSRFEVDLGTFEWDDPERVATSSQGGVALTEAPAYLAPPALATLPIVYPDSIEVQVLSEEGGIDLVAAIELVSPGNKDRPENRTSFVAKCATYLQQGIGVVIVDIVTSRRANLHEELSRFLGGECPMPGGTTLYASAYRPVRRNDDEHLDVWAEPMALGGRLPTMPLAIRRGPTVPIDLDATYHETCRRSRLPSMETAEDSPR
jgi:hypothetical protein